MPFDVFTMAAIRDELDATTTGARVDKILQPSELSVAFRLWKPGWSGHIVMAAAASRARIYATQGKLAKGFETPSSFLMLLRKYATGSRIAEIRQAHLERLLSIELDTHEFGRVSIITEIMGNHSNVILIDGERVVLGAIKLIGPRQSRVRRISPHVPYEPPPPQKRAPVFGEGPKLDPLQPSFVDAFVETIANAPADLSLRDGLVGLLMGCSPLVAGDVARRAGRLPADPVSGIAPSDLAAAVGTQYGLLVSHAWEPAVIEREGVAIDFKAYMLAEDTGAVKAPTMSAAIEAVSEGVESSDALRAGRTRLQGLIARRRSEIESRRASLQRGLQTAQRADELREAGNLILGFQYQLEPGSDTFEVPEGGITLSLDPSLTPVENAERYFKRYRKARDAGKRVPALLRAAEGDLEFVQELDTYADLAETPGDLKRVESELQTRFGPKAPAKAKEAGAGTPRSVDLGRGARALIGRSARQNEEVTFKLAGRNDIWLHAQGMPGAHVAVTGADTDALEQLEGDQGIPIRAAASLAAYYSKARQEKAADVIVARVRDIHRLPGGAPGQVTVRSHKTVRVAPRSPEDLDKHRDS